MPVTQLYCCRALLQRSAKLLILASLSQPLFSDIGELLENVEQAWTIGGNGSYITGDFKDPFNDGDAVKMERTGEDSAVWIETIVSGPFEVRYEWTLNYETEGRSERLEFLVDDIVMDEETESFDWHNESAVKITTEGLHTLRWLYVDENDDHDSIKNAAWLDAVFISQTPVIDDQPVSRALEAGEDYTLSVEAFSESPMDFQWFKDGTPISEATNAVLNLVSLSGTDSGNYTVEITNLHGTTVSTKVTVFVNEISIGEAADQPDWTWTVGGNGIWARQAEIKHDGEDAIAYLPIEGPHNLSLSTTVNGIGRVSFWWRSVDAPTHWGGVTFYVDGRIAETLYWSDESTKEWIKFTYDITTPGEHALKWAVDAIPEDDFLPSPYNYEETYGTWIDEVAFEKQPLLLSSPKDQFAQEGGSLSFSVSVASETPVSYQWRKDGLEIPGANSNTLTITSATLSDSGIYDVTITSGTYQMTSQIAKAIVSPPIGETLNQPDLEWTFTENGYGERGWFVQDEVTFDGSPALEHFMSYRLSKALLTISVEGPVTLSYWRKIEIAPEAGDIWSHPFSQSTDWERVSVAYKDEGLQNIKIGGYPNLPSRAFLGRMWIDKVELDYKPIITKNLEYASVQPGQSHTFEVQTASISPVSYQWMRNGIELPGETESTFSLENISTSDSGYYRVRTTNEQGTTDSGSAFLGISENLGAAVEQPHIEWTFGDPSKWFAQSDVTLDGVDALMCVVPNEAEPETNWIRANIQGPFRLSYWIREDTSRDELNTSLAANSGTSLWRQQVIKWNSNHPPSARIPIYPQTPNARIYIDQIEILRVPFFESHPLSTSVSEGQTLSFEAEIHSATLATYQWLKEGVPLTGATNSRLLIPNAKLADSGNYSVRVTNNDGTVISESATAHVFPAYQSIGEAFEQTSLAWTRSSEGSWYVQEDVSFDGSSALEVHAGDNTGNTWFETTIEGPATVSFFYINENDIEIYIDGARSHRLSDVSEWKPFSFSMIEEGPHTVRWVLDDYYEDLRFWFDKLTISHGPIITGHPQSKVIETGDPLEFSVTAASQTPIIYQWRKDGIDLPGATGSTLTIPAVTDTDYGNYDVVLSNGSANANSVLVSLTSSDHINQAIDTEGLDWTLKGEGMIEFQTVLARDHNDALAFKTGSPVWLEPEMGIETTFDGPATIEYWYFEGDTTPGYFSPTIDGTRIDRYFHPEYFQLNAYQSWTKVEIPVVQPGSHSLEFTLKRYGGYSLEKHVFLDQLEINQAPLIVEELPQVAILHPGQPHTLALSATSESDIAYQWRKDGVRIAGAIDETFTISDPQESDTGDYDVVLSNEYGDRISSSTRLIPNEWLQEALDAPNASFTVEGKGTLEFSKEGSPDGNGALKIKVEPEEIFVLESFVDSPAKSSFWWREDPSNCNFSRAWITLNGDRWQAADYDWSLHQIDGTDQRTSTLRWGFEARRDCTATFYLDALTIEPNQFIVNQPTELTAYLDAHFEIRFDWWDTTGASFQWRKDGESIPEATSRAFNIESFQASDAGSYDVAITSDSVTTYSEPVIVTTFSDRVSNAIEAGENIWTVSNPGNWLFTNEKTKDGVDAILTKSTASDPSWIETVIEGPATVSFWWNIQRGCPEFKFYVDGILKRSNRDDGWQEEHVMILEAGPNILRWELRETCGWSESLGWLDNVSIIRGPIISVQPISKTVIQGNATALNISSDSKGASYQWRIDGINIEGATSKTYTTLLPGSYDVVVSNGQTSRISNPATVEWTEAIGHLVEQPGLPWEMTEGPVWRASEIENFDGEDALTSPDYPITGKSSLSTTVEGPINFSFAYRVANEFGNNFHVSFYIDDQKTDLYDITDPWASAPNNIPWRQFIYSITEEGPHTLRWEVTGSDYRDYGNGPRFYLDSLLLLDRPVFVSQPNSQGLFVSDSLTLISEAASPMLNDSVTYQWYKDNVAIPGGTKGILSIANLDQSDSGNYFVVASNSSGESISETAQVTVLESPSDLLGLEDIPFSFGNPNERVSGALKLFIEGPGTLEFDWKLERPHDSGLFTLEINGHELRNRSELNDWQTERLYLDEGVHHVEWTMRRGLLSNVALDKKPFIETASPEVHSFIGETATQISKVTSSTPATFQWYHGDKPVSGATGTTLFLTTLEHSDSGEYTLHATNAFGTNVGSPILLEVFDRPGILLGLTEFDFLFSGDGQWSPPDSQNNRLCGPALNLGQQSSTSTMVDGPVSVAFDVRFFDQNLDHQFEFRVDGQLIYTHNSISFYDSASVRHTIAEPGEHELTWTVIADENETAGQTFACIENLEIIGDLGSIYDEWTQLVFQEIAPESVKDMHADPDGDTKSNILEYLLGSDPLLADGPVPIEGIEVDGRFYWESKLNLIAWVNGIHFSFETSSDLYDWQPLESEFEFEETGESALLRIRSIARETLDQADFTRLKLSFNPSIL